MLITGDRIKQINPLSCFDKVGDIFEVTDISKDGMITFTSPYGVGMMTWNEFNGHFEKVETLEWTPWIHENDYFYRTNGKQVKIKKDGIKARASCHPADDFDLDKGIAIALARIDVKKAEAKLAATIYIENTQNG